MLNQKEKKAFVSEVSVRPLKIEDAYTSVKWRNDAEVFKYTGNTYNHKILLSQELEWIKNVIKRENEIRYAIEADGVYVGNIYLTDIQDGEAHYHIFIGSKEHWGKGVAHRASLKILELAFEGKGLSSVLLNVDKRNLPAVRLYERLGFKSISENGNSIKMKCSVVDWQNLKNR